MIDKIFKYLSLPQKFCIVGIYELEGQTVYKSLFVRVTKNEIQFKKRVEFRSESEFLEDGISKTDAIILHLEGAVILTREVDNIAQYRKSLIYNENEDDFFFYEYVNGNTNYVSFTRMHHLQSWINKIENKGGVVTHLSIGPMVVSNLFKLLPENERFSTPSGDIIWKNNGLKFKPGSSEPFYLNFGTEKYDQFEVPLIASLIGAKYPGVIRSSAMGEIHKNNEEVKYRKVFKALGIVALPLFFLLIIFGHFYLNSLSNELVENEARFLSFQQNLDRISELKGERDIKLKILQTSGVFKNDYLTGYLMDICNSLPEEIRLTELNVFPLETRIKPNEKPLFNFNVIEIKGVSHVEKFINNWLGTLQEIGWQRKIEIISFSKEGEKIFNFHFKILL